MDYSLLGQECQDKINNGWNKLGAFDWFISHTDDEYDLNNTIDKVGVVYSNTHQSMNQSN